MIQMEKRRDLIINGIGSTNGGHFDTVKLNGNGTINGEVVCTNFESNGTGMVNGSLSASSARISGNGKINGNLETKALNIEGRGSIKGTTNVKKLKVSGKGLFGGNVKAEEIKLNGTANIEGNCETDIFIAEGQFTVGGLLSGDEINIHMFGESKAKEIGGQTIKVKQKSGTLLKMIKNVFPVGLEVEGIEGDNIEIEFTKADFVRGHHIKIGPNCKINLVEYSGTFTLDKSSEVKETKKI
jgi:cytoskeletal protein CcmA (bactofilin family)